MSQKGFLFFIVIIKRCQELRTLTGLRPLPKYGSKIMIWNLYCAYVFLPMYLCV